MESALYFILVPALAVFVLWMGIIILEKAGLPAKWIILLIIPVVNIAMVWVFAFIKWPNLKSDIRQDL